MPKITVYLPNDLAEWVKSSDLNVSAVVQHALNRRRILEEMARQVEEDRAAGLVDEDEVQKWLVKFNRTK